MVSIYLPSLFVYFMSASKNDFRWIIIKDPCNRLVKMKTNYQKHYSKQQKQWLLGFGKEHIITQARLAKNNYCNYLLNLVYFLEAKISFLKIMISYIVLVHKHGHFQTLNPKYIVFLKSINFSTKITQQCNGWPFEYSIGL